MKASWPSFIIILLYSFHSSMLPKKLCRLFHMICHYVVGARTLSLRTFIAILPLALIFPFPEGGKQHWGEPFRREHITQTWPIRAPPSPTLPVLQGWVTNKDQANGSILWIYWKLRKSGKLLENSSYGSCWGTLATTRGQPVREHKKGKAKPGAWERFLMTLF